MQNNDVMPSKSQALFKLNLYEYKIPSYEYGLLTKVYIPSNTQYKFKNLASYLVS